MKAILLFLFFLPYILFGQTDSLTKQSIPGLEDYFETLPEYPGGTEQFYAELYKHIKYPKITQRDFEEIRVYVEADFDSTGYMKGVSILKGHVGYNEAVLEGFEKINKQWKPGLDLLGKPKASKVKIPIVFSPE